MPVGKAPSALHDELAMLKAQREPSPDDYVFGTARGGKQSESNIRNRVLSKAVERANEQLTQAREAPLPHLTPHGCRRTFASIRYAAHRWPRSWPNSGTRIRRWRLRWGQDDGRESPQITTIESEVASRRKAFDSRRKVDERDHPQAF
jgi:hypothetical protein